MAAGKLNLVIPKGDDFEKNIFLGTGAQRRINSFSDGGTGITTVHCDKAHGQSNGAKVLLSGSKYYAGGHEISNVTSLTFDIPIAFQITHAGAKWCNSQDISIYTFAAQYRDTHFNPNILATFVCDVQGDGSSGHIKLSLAKSVTTDLKRNTGVWDVDRITTADSKIKQILEGICQVSPEVTR